MDKAIIPILAIISILVFVPISALGSVVAYPGYLVNYRYWHWNPNYPNYVPFYGGINPWLGLGLGAPAGGWPIHNNIHIYPGQGMPFMPMPPVIPNPNPSPVIMPSPVIPPVMPRVISPVMPPLMPVIPVLPAPVTVTPSPPIQKAAAMDSLEE